MSQNGPLPYLKFGDIEIANPARTLQYLRRGLGGTNSGHWEMGASDVCSVLYRVNGGTCVTPDAYVNPSIDPAPWYDMSESGSTSFLGLVVTDLEGYDSVLTRAVTQRMGGLGGGTLAAQYRKPRTWKFKGVLVSADDAGAEYGLRWLIGALATGDCDTCSTNSLTVRLVCPPDDCSDDSLGKWTAYESGLSDGPTETGAASDWMGGCRDWVDVEFTIMSGNPFLYRDPVVCLPEQTLGSCDVVDCTDICDFLTGAGEAPCCVVDPPERGTLGAIFALTSLSTTDFGQVQMQSRADCGDLVATQALTLSGIPAGASVLVNCADHTITVVDANGVVTDGQHLVVLPEGETIQWIEVAACDAAACICIESLSESPGSELAVEISTQLREG